MATIIRHARTNKVVTYTREFRWRAEPGAGFGFDCDEDGTLHECKHKAGHENLLACLNGTYDVEDLGVVRHVNHQRIPAAIRCYCGAEVELWDAWCSTCDKCGRDYNGGGELLAPRHQWGEETGENLTEMWPRATD